MPKSSDGGNIQKVTNYGSKSGGGSSSGANSDDDKVIYFWKNSDSQDCDPNSWSKNLEKWKKTWNTQLKTWKNIESPKKFYKTIEKPTRNIYKTV